jgi:hypothetical protein
VRIDPPSHADLAGDRIRRRACVPRRFRSALVYATLLSQEDADGLITERPDPVGVIMADCLPALIASR